MQAINDFEGKSSHIFDIPTNTKDSPDYIYQRFRDQIKMFRIGDVDTLKSAFCIRIFSDFNMSNTLQAISFQMRNNQWEGLFHFFPKNSTDSAVAYPSPFKVTPKIGWDRFINKLFTHNILYLPTMYKLPGLKLEVADGNMIFFEIGAENKYRCYYYYGAESLAKSCTLKECKLVIDIWNTILENFDFPSL